MTVVLALVLAMIPTETLQSDVDFRQDRPHFVEIDAGADHACGRTATGRVLCWGSFVWGQLGDGRTAATEETPPFGPPAFGRPEDVVRGRPVAVETSRPFRAVTTGGRHTCALTKTGEAYCWGGNWHGQLGDGTGSRVDPAVVDVDRVAEEVTVGPRHTCALGGERAWCWGEGTGAYVRGPDEDHPGALALVEDVERAIGVAAGGSAFGSFTCVLSGGAARCLSEQRPDGGAPPDTALPAVRERGES